MEIYYRARRYPEETLGHRFQLGCLEGSIAQWVQGINNTYPGFKWVLLILCKIFWHALTNVLFVNGFHWRYHALLCLRECVFRLHLTLYQGKRLFFIIVFSLIFLKNPKNSIINSFLRMFFTCKLCLCLFTFSVAA